MARHLDHVNCSCRKHGRREQTDSRTDNVAQAPRTPHYATSDTLFLRQENQYAFKCLAMVIARKSAGREFLISALRDRGTDQLNGRPDYHLPLDLSSSTCCGNTSGDNQQSLHNLSISMFCRSSVRVSVPDFLGLPDPLLPSFGNHDNI